jgi:hypothetical protein
MPVRRRDEGRREVEAVTRSNPARRSSALIALFAALALAGPPGVAAAQAAGPAPRFVEEADTAGIDHSYDGEWQFFTGGGVAALDCDADGRSDLYFAGGSNPAALYRNESPVGGALRFSHLADPATDLTEVVGAYPLDIDGDRNVDLAVLRLGENVLLRGLGDCRFERANETWSFDGGDDWTTAFSATWETGSTLPTIAVGNYIDTEADAQPACLDNQLFRGDGPGTAYAPPIVLSPGWCTLSILFSDWDRSGRRDLRVSNDRHYYLEGQGEEQLWRIEAGAEPRLYTEADGWQPLQIWGMGIASQDITGDGYPEVFLTSMADNKLQTLAGGPQQPTYMSITLERGATATHPFTGDDTALPSTAWHPEFEDVNNDGLMDLFIAKGNVDSMPDYAMQDPSNLLLGQPDGTFIEGAEAAGIVAFPKGRGAALADLNLDGLLDIVQVNRGANVSLWRSLGAGDATTPQPMGGWLAVDLEQPGPNHDAIGAWVEVRTADRTVERELTIGGGHAGGQLGWVHVGVGEADEAELRVVWPDGEEGAWMTVPANAFLVVDREAGEAQPWQPPVE